MEKKSYFEVTTVVSRWLTAGLLMVLLTTMLRQWDATFLPGTGPMGGAIGSVVSTLVRSGVGNALVWLVYGTGMLLMMEPMRRAMRRSGDRFWLLMAFWEVLVAVSAMVFAMPGQESIYSYAHTPTAWERFRTTFLYNEQVVSGCVQVVMACVFVARYRGRIRWYGVSKLVCPLMDGAGVALFYEWGQEPGEWQSAILLGYFLLRTLMALVPAAMLRLTMSTRIDVRPAADDGDVASV